MRSRASKIGLAVATVWPLVYLFGLLSVISRPEFLHSLSDNSQRASGGFSLPIRIVLALSLITALEFVALIVVYIGHMFDNHRITGDRKALWAVILFFGGFFGMAIYWIMFIWPERSNLRPY